MMQKMRQLEESIFKILMISSLVAVLLSFLYILITICAKGLPSLSLDIIFSTPKGGYYLAGSGGIMNAIAGSLILAVSATLLALLFSLPVALYMNVYLRVSSRYARLIRLLLDISWGIPSIIYGAFGFIVMVLFRVQTSLLAGIVVVAVLVLPIMIRAMDEVMKTVPRELAESAYALGSTRLEVAWHVMLRQTFPGLVTAVLVSFGRGIGDAASVLLTAGFTDSMPYSLFKPVATLPLAIFFQLNTPFPEAQERGYASAIVLTAITFAACLIARYFSNRINNRYGRAL